MIFPRALALAELAWTSKAQRNYDHFLQRLRAQNSFIKQAGLNYSPHFDDINFAATPLHGNAVQITLQSSLPGGNIRFTTDNSMPTSGSELYTGPVTVTKTGTFKALVFDKQEIPPAVCSRKRLPYTKR